MGFLRLPYIERNDSFALGFVTALAALCTVAMLLAAWNKGRGFLGGLIGKKTASEHSKNTRFQTVVWIILVGLPLSWGLVRGCMLHRRYKTLEQQVQVQDAQFRAMSARLQARNNQELVPLMRDVLGSVGEALKRSRDRSLDDETIDKLAGLCRTFEPYRYLQGDSLSDRAYSPERGQLFQSLLLLDIHPQTLARIRNKVSFAGADLSNMDLKGQELSNIDLSAVNLRNADLSDANLKNTNLAEADLWGANLSRANIDSTNLRRADLRWAKLNAATLRQTNLNGALLSNTQFLRAKLSDTNIQWAQSDGTLYTEAVLTRVNMTGTKLTKANLTQARMRDIDLRRVDLEEADLSGADLENVLVDEDWQGKIKEWRPMGIDALLEKHAVVSDTFDKAKRPLFRFKRK